jgi:hypothetical protein
MLLIKSLVHTREIYRVESSELTNIGIAYSIPDLDGKVRIWIKSKETGEDMACLEASLSNGKTVDQKAVGWASAIIAGLGLLASAITSGLGHSTTAAHVAANAMSLFGFFQAQSMVGMTAISLPPIVAAWAQNFDWSMGLIRIRIVQRFLTWYINSTGGVPSHLHENLDRVSIGFMRRSVELTEMFVARSLNRFQTRSNNGNYGTCCLQIELGNHQCLHDWFLPLHCLFVYGSCRCCCIQMGHRNCNQNAMDQRD